MGGCVILSLALKDFVGCSGCIEKVYIFLVREEKMVDPSA